jgi:hypothetical protein
MSTTAPKTRRSSTPSKAAIARAQREANFATSKVDHPLPDDPEGRISPAEGVSPDVAAQWEARKATAVAFAADRKARETDPAREVDIEILHVALDHDPDLKKTLDPDEKRALKGQPRMQPAPPAAERAPAAAKPAASRAPAKEVKSEIAAKTVLAWVNDYVAAEGSTEYDAPADGKPFMVNGRVFVKTTGSGWKFQTAGQRDNKKVIGGLTLFVRKTVADQKQITERELGTALRAAGFERAPFGHGKTGYSHYSIDAGKVPAAKKLGERAKPAGAKGK